MFSNHFYWKVCNFTDLNQSFTVFCHNIDSKTNINAYSNDSYVNT